MTNMSFYKHLQIFEILKLIQADLKKICSCVYFLTKVKKQRILRERSCSSNEFMIQDFVKFHNIYRKNDNVYHENFQSEILLR